MRVWVVLSCQKEEDWKGVALLIAVLGVVVEEAEEEERYGMMEEAREKAGWEGSRTASSGGRKRAATAAR